jgi:hypothetical protein
MKLVVPMPINLANSRMHWRVRHRKKEAYWALLNTLKGTKNIPRPPRQPPLKATISAVMYLHNPMDDGNAMGRMKWVEDWLTSWGYITDDSKKHLEWTGFPKQVIDRKNPRIEIELKEAA